MSQAKQVLRWGRMHIAYSSLLTEQPCKIQPAIRKVTSFRDGDPSHPFLFFYF